MSDFLKFLFLKIEWLIGFSGLITKFIIGFGICLILCYFIYIDYFPTDLSLGDGLLFFVITIKFLLVYILFLSAHYSFGRIMIFILKSILNTFIFLFNIRENLKNHLNIEMITLVNIMKYMDKFSIYFIKFILYIFGFALVFIFYNEKSVNLLLMVFISILLACFIKEFIKFFRSNLSYSDELLVENIERKHIKIVIMLMSILLIPSFIYLAYSQKQNNFLINSTLASIQEDDKKSIIFIKFGLKDLFPKSKIGETKGEY